MNTIVFDLDDTLLRDDRSISDYTIRTLRTLSAQGFRILPASGRARHSMEGYVRQIGCCEHFIACNGAEVWSLDGERLLAMTLPEQTVLDVIGYGESQHVYMHTYDGDCFYYNVQSHYAEAYAASSQLHGVLCPDLKTFVSHHPTCKILMMDDPEKITRMREEAGRIFAGKATVTTSKPYFLEINPVQATKGLALKWCSEHLGFDLKQTVCFGDSLNDLSMLLAAGLSVAVKNAREEVRRETDLVTEVTNNEDGVALFLEAHFLFQHAPGGVFP